MLVFKEEIKKISKFKIEWRKDGAPIVYSQRYFTEYFLNEKKAVLIIEDVRLEDQGKYEVTARNPAGVGSSVASLLIKLAPHIDETPRVYPDVVHKFELKTPKVAPEQPESVAVEPVKARIKIIEPLKDAYIVEGSQAVLDCKIDAYPKAIVRSSYSLKTKLKILINSKTFLIGHLV